MKRVIQKFQDKAWKHGVLSAILFLLSYGAGSWGIDSGRLTAYFIAIVLLILAIKQLIKAIRKAYGK